MQQQQQQQTIQPADLRHTRTRSPDVPIGVHILDVLSDTYDFEPVRPGVRAVRPSHLGLSPNAHNSPRRAPPSQLLITLHPSSIHVQPHSPSLLPRRVTPTLPSLPYPLLLPAIAQLDPFDPPPSLGLGALLASPMALMMVATAALAFGLPSLMKWMGEMDPESAKEVAEMRRRATEFQTTDWGEKWVPRRMGGPGRRAH